ncbi:MAG: type II secretion system minor pseudopilin GspI [Proteobacteria bacterium]|nr:type II secretion system minor pseudopilin GspI [Pseudomonadota bacterium]HQR02575.1 type II secretion system minor pseudopilin GspI [Rhodocyclaceae bacterium]
MNITRGFTLLEALIALAVLAIGLGTVMRALGISAQATDQLRQRQLALWVAQNHLDEMRVLRQFPALGNSSGQERQGKETFIWRMRVLTTPNPGFRRMEVQVYGVDTSSPLATLTGFATVPQ